MARLFTPFGTACLFRVPWHSCRLLLLGATVAVGSGCSTLFEGTYDFREGWRKGEVVRIVAGEEIQRPRYWRCSRRATAGELAGRKFALLAYDEVPYRPRRYLVAVPIGLELHAGQPVYVNVFACDHAIALRAATMETTFPRRGG